MRHQDWPFHQFFAAGFGPRSRAWCGPEGAGPRHRRRRHQMFEAGEVKDVILRLLKEKPRHGYEIMRALEERMGGWYTPSAGTVYPTLQLLEDQGYVRLEEQEGKKVYHITPEGERFLDENKSVVEDILDRVRDTLRDFAGGHMADLNGAFARLASVTFKRAWRWGPDHPAIPRVIEILRRATDDIDKEWERGAEP